MLVDVDEDDRDLAPHWVRHCLSDMIYGSVFDRFPQLKVGAFEFEIAWV